MHPTIVFWKMTKWFQTVLPSRLMTFVSVLVEQPHHHHKLGQAVTTCISFLHPDNNRMPSKILLFFAWVWRGAAHCSNKTSKNVRKKQGFLRRRVKTSISTSARPTCKTATANVLIVDWFLGEGFFTVSTSCLRVCGSGESSPNGKAQYRWPPRTRHLRSSALDVANTILLYYKTSYLNVEVNGIELSPSVSVPWWVTSTTAAQTSEKEGGGG